MKKFLLIALLSGSLYTSAYSQTLYNTTWSVYDPTDVFFSYFKFTFDTLLFSPDNIVYTAVSNFTVSGNTFNIYDLSPLTGCSVTDTGHYTFTITNDTLRFTLISDLCTTRSSVLSIYYGVLFATGIQVHDASMPVNVFPNPSPSGIFNLITGGNSGYDKFSVTTVDGKIILEQTLAGNGSLDQTLSLAKFPSGIYFLTLYNNKEEKKIFKLLK
jgi:hypothetical protein